MNRKRRRRVSRYQKDMQAKRAYKWENALVCMNDKFISQKQIVELYRWLSGIFDIKTDIAFDKTHTVYAWVERQRKGFGAGCSAFFLSWQPFASTDVRLAYFTPRAYKTSIVLHEFAHDFIDKFIERHDDFADKTKIIQIHGKEWLTVYMILLNRVMKIDVDILERSAKNFKLKYIPELLRKHAKTS